MRVDFLYVVCAGFVSGVIFRSFVYSKISLAVVVIMASFTFLIGKKKLRWVIVVIFCVSLGFGMLRYDIRDENPARTAFETELGQKVSVEGVVSSEPSAGENAVSMIVASPRAKIVVTSSLYSSIHYGDRVKLEGIIDTPKNFDDGTGRVFDYVAYLAKDEVYYEMRLPAVTLIDRHQGNPIKEMLYVVKENFLQRLEKVLPTPYSALEGGLLLGTKQSLGKKLQEDFRRAGIIHIVVLSGYNITIIADAMMNVFSFLPRRYGASFGIVGVILFAIMTGGEATVVRATIMALIVVGAKITSRPYDVTRALCVAALIMVIGNPKIVVFDSSFQLSFMSTLGLIYIGPILKPKLEWITEWCKIREIVTTTLSTQIFVMPILLYKMGELSVVGIPVNILILGFIPVTMLAGFITGLVSFFSGWFAWIGGSLTYVLLWYEIGVVEFFAHLPFASLKISYFPLWAAVLVYVVYFVVYLKYVHLTPALRDRPSP